MELRDEIQCIALEFSYYGSRGIMATKNSQKIQQIDGGSCKRSPIARSHNRSEEAHGY